MAVSRFCSFSCRELYGLAQSCKINTISGNKLSVRLASTYKAAVLKEINKPVVIDEIKKTELKENQVRILTHACSLNASDLLACQGITDVHTLPFIPGYELAGEILEVKKEKSKEKDKKKKEKDDEKHDSEEEEDSELPFQNGERVVALIRDRVGGCAEQCVVDIKDVWRIPPELDYRIAVALVETYSMALLGLHRRAKITNKDVVLVTAGQGGLGTAAVDIAANVYKAKVIGVCGSEKCGEQLRLKGAWNALAVDSSSGDKLKKRVKELNGGQGVDVAFETVGGQLLECALLTIGHEGRLVVSGSATESTTQDCSISLSKLFSGLSSFTITGVSLASYRNADFKTYRQTVSDVLEMYEQGLLAPHISKTFTLANVNDALLHIKETEEIGKVIITTE